jgi:hypothetical protein
MGIMTICNIAAKVLQFLQDANGVRRSAIQLACALNDRSNFEYILLANCYPWADRQLKPNA